MKWKLLSDIRVYIEHTGRENGSYYIIPGYILEL